MSMKSILCLCLFVCLGTCVWGKSIFIESENTMGVHRIEGKEGNQVIPVPWTTLGTPDVEPVTPITISNLVSVADMSGFNEDKMKSFNKDHQVFDGWVWTIYMWSYPTIVWSDFRLEADKTPIDRGEALWLELHKDMDVYLIGQASTNAPVSKLVSGTENRLENFLANPYDIEVDILDRIDGAVRGDVINVVTTTNSVMYWYEKPEASVSSLPLAWCTLEMITVIEPMPWGDEEFEVLAYVPCSQLMIPPNSGVWYTSQKTASVRETQPKIRWPRMKGEE